MLQGLFRWAAKGGGSEVKRCLVEADGVCERSVARSPFLASLSDDDLHRLNSLLPWSCYVLDDRGRRFGKPWSAIKRTTPQQIPDPRILELNRRFPLDGLEVLEIGCHEGIHTAALCSLASRVLAVDSRIENVVKTIVRCALLGHMPQVCVWDVEGETPSAYSPACDILHHVGVLYHLSDPIRHLHSVLPFVRKGLMLDTHVATEETATEEYAINGRVYRYRRYREGGRQDPFSGMRDHAKWLREADLVATIRDAGFREVAVAEQRSERNGPRVLMFAAR